MNWGRQIKNGKKIKLKRHEGTGIEEQVDK
jgi:hypothetical protein